ncbi:hypothetical protein Moror_8195 [Moniliophthora roreri MCA 2997]|uniref:DUF6699 domain-containing protein n=1 Tax=Moniliophthora roreri (strain MCA 2997) TaxID=1381753 RepID=V2XP68_MONRO|nr:hypothetical protein Moror_8195 [Moniliophthora roreri MCA 2997]
MVNLQLNHRLPNYDMEHHHCFVLCLLHLSLDIKAIQWEVSTKVQDYDEPPAQPRIFSAEPSRPRQLPPPWQAVSATKPRYQRLHAEPLQRTTKISEQFSPQRGRSRKREIREEDTATRPLRPVDSPSQYNLTNIPSYLFLHERFRHEEGIHLHPALRTPPCLFWDVAQRLANATINSDGYIRRQLFSSDLDACVTYPPSPPLTLCIRGCTSAPITIRTQGRVKDVLDAISTYFASPLTKEEWGMLGADRQWRTNACRFRRTGGRRGSPYLKLDVLDGRTRFAGLRTRDRDGELEWMLELL